MTVTETYEKYRHLDTLLSDQQGVCEWFGSAAVGALLTDLWLAVKSAQAIPPAHHRTDDLIHRLTQLQEWAQEHAGATRP